MSIEKKYNVTKLEAAICRIIRVIRGTSKCPGFIYKR